MIDTGTASCTMTGHTCNIDGSANVSVSVTSGIAASTPLTVTVSSVSNAIEAKTTDSFQLYTYYDSQYDSLVDLEETNLTVTMTAKVLASGTATPASLITYELTTYDIDLPIDDPIPVDGSIVVVFPSTISPESSALTAASFSTTSCSTQEPLTNRI